TTLAAFLPLLFWPGIVGEFMKFMPLTLIFTLSASLAMALIFLPTIGAILPGGGFRGDATLGGLSERYGKVLEWALKRPGKILLAMIGSFVGTIIIYAAFGSGVEFFPDIEPERANVVIHAKGDLSIQQQD